MKPQVWKEVPFEEEVCDAMQVKENGELFLSQLRTRLLAQPVAVRGGHLRFRLNKMGVSAAVLIVLAAVILWLGPGRVYAGLQTLLGYVPGVGFVSTENGWGLKETVNLKRGSEQIQVEQLVTSNQETFLVLHLQGFPTYQEIGLSEGIVLRLADGTELHPNNKMVEVNPLPGEYWGVFQFHSLPDRARSLTVVWNPFGKQGGTESQSWEIAVNLFPLSEAEAAALLPKAYTPEGASAEQHDITLKVEEVSQSLRDTALKVRMTFPSDFLPIYLNEFVLRDDHGRQYPQIERGIHFEDQGQPLEEINPTGDAGQAYRTYTTTYAFLPLDPTAKQLTFQVNALTVRAKLEQNFRIDLGEKPQIGDHWEIHQRVTNGDLTFEVRQARLIPLQWEGQNLVGLVLDLAPVDQENVQINQLWLGLPGKESAVYHPETRTWLPGWPVDALPKGEVNLTLKVIEVILNGNWEMTWGVGEY